MGKRPDGLEESQYKNWKKWSGNKWAWEFLRRNLEFQGHCSALEKEDTREKREQICQRWGLRHFKDYKEPFKKKGGKVASFVTSVRIFANKSELNKIFLSAGQVAVVFNCRYNIKKQLAFVSAQLKDMQVRQKNSGVIVDDSDKRPRLQNFLYCLRTLDSELVKGRTKKELAELIYGAKKSREANIDQTRRDHLKQAKRYRDEGYLFLPWILKTK